ncbi:MAG: ABC transporter ATP-binding protein [bacterium]|nr:ABC transporter ATP-binding protein [bacterium]
MGGEAVADLRGVSVAFRHRRALSDISLSIRRNEFVGVAGPNGSGKSTLLRLLNGLVAPTAGSVELFGRPLSGRHLREARRRIGYLPQHCDYDPAFPATVREVVMMGRWPMIRFFRRPSREDRMKIEEVSRRTGLGDLLGRPVGHLSGGERRKMGIARAMAQDPAMLMLDEPTSDLDIAAQAEIGRLVERVHGAGGLTVLFVTHFISHLPPCCSRFLLMKDGRIAYDGPRAGALDEGTLAALYGCPVRTVVVDGRVAVFPGGGNGTAAV